MSPPRRTAPQLVADEWLVELAARDDPLSVIDPQLLARFAHAGVVQLVPSDGTESLAVGDAARATGIGAHGPGFGFGESFEDEPAPTAGALARLCEFVERFDRLRRLRLAAVDMGFVVSTARQFADRLGPASRTGRASAASGGRRASPTGSCTTGSSTSCATPTTRTPTERRGAR